MPASMPANNARCRVLILTWHGCTQRYTSAVGALRAANPGGCLEVAADAACWLLAMLTWERPRRRAMLGICVVVTAGLQMADGEGLQNEAQQMYE